MTHAVIGSWAVDRSIGEAVDFCDVAVYASTLTLRAPETWETQWDTSGSKRLEIATHDQRG